MNTPMSNKMKEEMDRHVKNQKVGNVDRWMERQARRANFFVIIDLIYWLVW